MRKDTKPLPTESPLLFDINPEPVQETLTALRGIPLVVQGLRSLGLPQSVKEHVQAHRMSTSGRGFCPETNSRKSKSSFFSRHARSSSVCARTKVSQA
jgi:hypothetical protein